jgi:hypothetical protein
MGRNFKLPSKKWLWPASVVLVGLSSCAVVAVVAVITLLISAVNCSNGNCSSLLPSVSGVAANFSEIVKLVTVLDPPASSLTNFHASQASALLAPNNIKITSSGGTATVTIEDANTGTILGSDAAPFVINNGVATFSDPAQVTDWMHSFSTYSGNVNIRFGFNTGTSNPPPGQSGSLTVTAEYAGSPYASAKASILASVYPKCPPLSKTCQPQ